MQRSSVAVALVSALLVVGAGMGGALAATDSHHAQQSPTGTTDAGSETSTGDGATATGGTGVTFDDQNGSGESVVVRVNDRGPYAKRRVLDLSKGAAQRWETALRRV